MHSLYTHEHVISPAVHFLSFEGKHHEADLGKMPQVVLTVKFLHELLGGDCRESCVCVLWGDMEMNYDSYTLTCISHML